MARPTLSSYIRENLDNMEGKSDPGPFVTISRQFGCDGYRLGDILLEKLEARPDEDGWRLYKKEILKQLAEDSGLTEDVIEKERKPSQVFSGSFSVVFVEITCLADMRFVIRSPLWFGLLHLKDMRSLLVRVERRRLLI